MEPIIRNKIVPKEDRWLPFDAFVADQLKIARKLDKKVPESAKMNENYKSYRIGDRVITNFRDILISTIFPS